LRQSYGDYGVRHNPNEEVIGQYQRAGMEERRHHGRVEITTELEAHELG
jgi:hypothetical protein